MFMLGTYLGYHEWYEQLIICDLVTGGKGSLGGASGEGHRATRSACAIGILESSCVCPVWKDQEYCFDVWREVHHCRDDSHNGEN